MSHHKSTNRSTNIAVFVFFALLIGVGALVIVPRHKTAKRTQATICCNISTNNAEVQVPLLPDNYMVSTDSAALIYKQRADLQWESIARQFYICRDSIKHPVPMQKQKTANSRYPLAIIGRVVTGCFPSLQGLLGIAKVIHEKEDYETLKKDK